MPDPTIPELVARLRELHDTDEEPFVSIARARIAHIEGRELVPRESLRAEKPPRQVSLFELCD